MHRERDRAETEWYTRWFGEEYLELYPHRDEEEARLAVELVLRHTRLPEGSRVLDLACGAGRHLAELHHRGMRTFGLDLSLPLLQRAREGPVRLPVVRGDMRALPFAPAVFRLVTSFFTSFGYFADAREDRVVLAEVRRVLAESGWFAFDFLNAERVRAELRPRDDETVNGRRVTQERRLLEGGRIVEKRIRIESDDPERPEVFHERVRLYEPEELPELLSGAGLAVQGSFGDYDGSPFHPDSPRVILIGRRR